MYFEKALRLPQLCCLCQERVRKIKKQKEEDARNYFLTFNPSAGNKEQAKVVLCFFNAEKSYYCELDANACVLI